jgi:peptide/nickel transport system permease protein
VRRRVAARLGQAIVVLWIVATLAFVLIHAAPGDPFDLASPHLPDSVRSQLRANFGLDQSLPDQYILYLRNTLRGDLGFSLSMYAPVREVIAARLPRTLLLMAVAIVMSFALGIWLALFQVRRGNTWPSRMAGEAALIFYSIPDFLLALVLLLTFAFWIPIFPAAGPAVGVTGGAMVLDYLKHLVLPALTLTLLSTAGVARYQRAELMELLPLDFVRTARAKGATEQAVFRRHVLRNALIPTITLAGLAFPALLGGAVIVEKVFSWPGMGLLTIDAIGNRDYPLVMASVLIGAIMVIAGNLLADLGYMLADPRLSAR